MTSTQIDAQTQGGLRGFLNKGGFWPLLLVVAVYFAIYLPAGKVVANLADRSYSEADTLSSVGTVFVQLTAALIVGSIVLIAFTTLHGLERRDLRPPVDLPLPLDVARARGGDHPHHHARVRHRLGWARRCRSS